MVGIDIAGPVTEGFRFADYADIYAECRRAGLGLTVHAGETGGADEVRDAVVALAGSHRPRRARVEDPRCWPCCASGHGARGLSQLEPEHRRAADRRRRAPGGPVPWSTGGVRFTISTDGPEMLRSYLRDELGLLMRHEILSLDEVQRRDRGRRGGQLPRPRAHDRDIVTGREGGAPRRAPIPVEAGS